MDRRRFLFTSAAAVAAGSLRWVPGAAAQPAPSGDGSGAAPRGGGVVSRDVRTWGVEGLGWPETADDGFRRLPARAKAVVREPVWRLAGHTAGVSADFETDAEAIHVRYRLTEERLALPHMPATGVSGADLYGWDDAEGRWVWLGVTFPEERAVEAELVSGLAPVADGGTRRYRLYFPLYNGVEAMEVGVAGSAAFAGVPPRQARPIVYYGTSVGQGACASRPGMAYTTILSRRLDTPLVNLGFSGNGRMELEVARLMTEQDPAAYLIDCVSNCTPEILAERTEPLVRTLREAHPDVPIVLVEDRTEAGVPLVPARREEHDRLRAALRGAYERLLEAGVGGLHYVPGEDLLGDDPGAMMTDGIHPSDMGMARYADVLEPVLRGVLGR